MSLKLGNSEVDDVKIGSKGVSDIFHNGVNVFVPQTLIGEVISFKGAGFTPGNFIDSSDAGTSFTFDTTKIDISSSDATVEFSDYIEINANGAGDWEHTSYERWRQTVHLTLDNVDANSFGISLGTRGSSESEDFFNHVRIALSSGGDNLKPFQYDDSGFSRQKVGSKIGTVSGSIDIWIEVERDYDVYKASVYNDNSGVKGTQIGITQTISATTQYNDSTSVWRYPLAGRWAMSYFGRGVMEILEWNIEVLEYRNPKWLMLGDSNTMGNRTLKADRWTEEFKTSMNLTNDELVTMVGFGQRNDDFTRVRNQIKYINPRNILLNVGSNDVALGTANLNDKFDTLVENILADLPHTNLFLSTVIARNGVNLASFNAHIVSKATTESLSYVDLFDATQDDVTAGNLEASFSVDGIHGNAAMHTAIDARIRSDLSL